MRIVGFAVNVLMGIWVIGTLLAFAVGVLTVVGVLLNLTIAAAAVMLYQALLGGNRPKVRTLTEGQVHYPHGRAGVQSGLPGLSGIGVSLVRWRNAATDPPKDGFDILMREGYDGSESDLNVGFYDAADGGFQHQWQGEAHENLQVDLRARAPAPVNAIGIEELETLLDAAQAFAEQLSAISSKLGVGSDQGLGILDRSSAIIAAIGKIRKALADPRAAIG